MIAFYPPQGFLCLLFVFTCSQQENPRDSFQVACIATGKLSEAQSAI
jgi:hypothetical protein